MKRTLFVLLAFIIMWPLLAYSGEYEVKGKAGGYTLEAKIDKNPPARGSNNLTIMMKDKASKPVTGAQVQVHYFMPSFPGKPPMMEYTATAQPVGDHYQAQMDLSMAGEWTVEIKVKHQRSLASTKFTFIVK
ncbi:MAG TPA: FixH family protein [Syntrophorhabdaceae bacterium]|nr:FixH family protein [Syntrophorhabdaceae bacterium]